MLGFPLIIATTAFMLVARAQNELKEAGSDFAGLSEVLQFLWCEGVPDIGVRVDEVSTCFGPASNSESILFALLDIDANSPLAKALGGVPRSRDEGFPLNRLPVL
jgi:hypothetical protein